MFRSVMAAAVEVSESHTVDWWIVWSAILLASVTLTTAIVTGVQSWIAWKTLKIESARANHVSDNATVVANNSIDSMEHVAVVALTHNDRVRQMKHLKSHTKKNGVI